MFDWVRNTPVYKITDSCPDVSRLKLKIFNFFFFQQLNFPINNCKKLQPIQKLVKHLQWSSFAKIFLAKFTKKTSGTESLFNKASVLYPTTSLKERTSTRVFSNEFFQILKTHFLRNSSRRMLCSTEIYFANKIEKILLRNKKMGSSL